MGERKFWKAMGSKLECCNTQSVWAPSQVPTQIKDGMYSPLRNLIWVFSDNIESKELVVDWIS